MTDELDELAEAINGHKSAGWDTDQIARVLSLYGWTGGQVRESLERVGWPDAAITELIETMKKRTDMLRREDQARKVYLGDGAYVELAHGGDSVKLTTSNGRHDTNQIYLGRRELHMLLSWLRDTTSIEFPARY